MKIGTIKGGASFILQLAVMLAFVFDALFLSQYLFGFSYGFTEFILSVFLLFLLILLLQVVPQLLPLPLPFPFPGRVIVPTTLLILVPVLLISSQISKAFEPPESAVEAQKRQASEKAVQMQQASEMAVRKSELAYNSHTCISQTGPIFDPSKCPKSKQIDYEGRGGLAFRCHRIEKGEFETTPEYTTRKSKCVADWTDKDFFVYIDDVEVSYNADTKKLLYKTSSDSYFSGGDCFGIGKTHTSQPEYYSGENAFGVKKRVTESRTYHDGMQICGLPKEVRGGRWLETPATIDAAKEAKAGHYSVWIRLKLNPDKDGEFSKHEGYTSTATTDVPRARIDSTDTLRVNALEYKIFRVEDNKVIVSRNLLSGKKK